MFRLSPEDSRQIQLLLTPSWLSGLIIVVLAFAISVGSIIAFEAHSSSVTQELLNWQQSTKVEPALTQPGDIVAESDRQSLSGSWPLLILWSVVGLLVYAIAAALLHSIGKAEELRESLNYVHVKPNDLLVIAAEHFLLRAIATVVLIGCSITFWKQIVPYSITAAHAAAADIISLDGFLYAVLSLLLIAVSLHILTILLRLSFGKARLTSDI